MSYLLSGLPLLLLAGALSKALRRGYASCFPLAVLGSVFVLYVTGLFHALSVGVYLIYALGLTSLVILILHYKKRIGQRGLFRPTPAAVLSVLILIFSYLLTRGRQLLNWDEFSHWSTVVKNMWLLNEFGSVPASTAIYKSYPPAIGLFQYYFMFAETGFIEANLYAAKDVFALSLLLPFFEDLRWRDVSRLLLLTLLLLALPLIEYYYFYRSIHVDGLMGLLIGYTLFSYYESSARTKLYWLSPALGLFALCQMKSSGFGIALLTALMMYAEYWFFRRDRKSLDARFAKNEKRVFVLLPLILLVFAKLSWELTLRLDGAVDYWSMGASLSPTNLLNGFLHPAPYQKETLERFFSALFALREDTYAVKLSPLSWVILPCLPLAWAYLKGADGVEKRRIPRIAMLMLIGYAFWLVVLLISFLFVFADFEALNLDGFERYSSTYQLGVLVFVLYLTLNHLYNAEPKKLTARLSILVLASLMLFNGTDLMRATLIAPQYNRLTQRERADYPSAAALTALDPDKDRVLLIGQHPFATGLDFYYLRYEATPVYVGMLSSWSIGEPYDADDDWTASFTPETWSQAVLDSDYTHLYLYRIDAQFVERFGIFFDDAPVDGGLYRIERGEGLRFVA